MPFVRVIFFGFVFFSLGVTAQASPDSIDVIRVSGRVTTIENRPSVSFQAFVHSTAKVGTFFETLDSKILISNKRGEYSIDLKGTSSLPNSLKLKLKLSTFTEKEEELPPKIFTSNEFKCDFEENVKGERIHVCKVIYDFTNEFGFDYGLGNYSDFLMTVVDPASPEIVNSVMNTYSKGMNPAEFLAYVGRWYDSEVTFYYSQALKIYLDLNQSKLKLLTKRQKVKIVDMLSRPNSTFFGLFKMKEDIEKTRSLIRQRIEL